MPNTVVIEERYVDEKTIYVEREGDNQYVGFLANALHLAARDGYKLVSAMDGHHRLILKFARAKDDRPAPVMRKRS